jgi:hypothetical protein
MHSICRGSTTVSVKSNNINYVIGFKSLSYAKKVQYNIHPEPKIILLKSNVQIVKNEELSIDITIDNEATLFIEKHLGDVMDPLNDGGFHISTTKINDFILYPNSKNIGIILPFDLLDETENEFIFKSFVIDPPSDFSTEFFRF